MKLRPTNVQGVLLIEPEPDYDERGYFARLFSTGELMAVGFDTRVALCAISQNISRGTLRGMHFQVAPHEEAKIVRCIRGAIYDVAVDLRVSSETYRAWTGHILTADNELSLAIPPGCAHGFLTLTDDARVYYQISAPYTPSAARGLRWNDPGLAIGWPSEPLVISERDRTFSDYEW